jgi:DNA-binding transcriptional ArsR family regulator
MVKYRIDPLSTTFQALADPTRRAILGRLTLGEATVCELAEPFDMSLPAVSKHLTVLEGAGLLHRQRDGRIRRCHLDTQPMIEAADWISDYRRFWEAQLDRLEQYLNETNTTEFNEQEQSNGPSTEKE